MTKENPSRDLKEIKNPEKIPQNSKEEVDFSKDEVTVVEEDGKPDRGPLHILDVEKKDIETLNAQIITC